MTNEENKVVELITAGVEIHENIEESLIAIRRDLTVLMQAVASEAEALAMIINMLAPETEDAE